jgi:hypothetical protein
MGDHEYTTRRYPSGKLMRLAFVKGKTYFLRFEEESK